MPKSGKAGSKINVAQSFAYIPVNEEIQTKARDLKDRLDRIYLAETPLDFTRPTAPLILKMIDAEEAAEVIRKLSEAVIARMALVPPIHEEAVAMEKSFSWLANNLGKDGTQGDEATPKEFRSCPRLFGDDCHVALLLDHYLPTCFVELVEDLAETNSPYYKLNDRLLELIAAFREVLTSLRPVRVNLIGLPKGLRQEIETAQVRLLHLLEWIGRNKTNMPPHHVVITYGGKGDPACAINGLAKTMKSQIRTLCTLSLLAKKGAFSVEEFCENYFGDTTGDNAKRFDKCMNGVRPLVADACGQGQRAIRGVNFGVVWNGEESIEEYLRSEQKK